MKQTKRAWRERNREHIAARNSEWYMQNRERRAAVSKAYRESHKEECAARTRRYYRRHKGQKAASDKLWRERNVSKILLNSARHRARKFGVEFNLTAADFDVPEKCPVFGVKLYKGAGKLTPSSPTLDRIDPKKGYVRGNVAVISHFANALKGKGTAAQHRRIAEWIESVVTA